MTELKTLKDLKAIIPEEYLRYPFMKPEMVGYDDLKQEAIKEINNLNELEYILGLMSEPEKRILIKYIKWKNNITEEELKNGR